MGRDGQVRNWGREGEGGGKGKEGKGEIERKVKLGKMRERGDVIVNHVHTYNHISGRRLIRGSQNLLSWRRRTIHSRPTILSGTSPTLWTRVWTD